MGYFSYRCAVSKQSIPVDAVEPTEVVVVLPDDSTLRGIWDGYGRILPSNIRRHRGADDEQLRFHPKLAKLLGSDDFDVVESNVKMVKARYYDPAKHVFANLPASERCPEQGFFYSRSGSWNRPAYPKKKSPQP